MQATFAGKWIMELEFLNISLHFGKLPFAFEGKRNLSCAYNTG